MSAAYTQKEGGGRLSSPKTIHPYFSLSPPALLPLIKKPVVGMVEREQCSSSTCLGCREKGREGQSCRLKEGGGGGGRGGGLGIELVGGKGTEGA